MRLKSTTYIVCLILLLIPGCGDGPTSAPEDTAELPGDTAGDVESAPTIITTYPADGSLDVNPDVILELIFSEAMDPGNGVTTISGGDDLRNTDAAGGEWVNGRTWQWRPPQPLRATTHYVVSIRDFTSTVGTPIVTTSFAFDTADATAPTVVSSSPEEGATGVPSDGQITLVFSETMVSNSGTLTLVGGMGDVEDVQLSGDTVTARLVGLEYETDYRLVVNGYTDLAGVHMNGTPYLGDGALDFRTGLDMDAPDVVMAMPGEGALDVDLDFTTEVVVTWDEPMATGITTATIDNGGTDLFVITGVWSNNDRVITFDVTGYLLAEGPHRLDLRGLEDQGGNLARLDGYLNDGWLDFVMGQDASAPEVVVATPDEGENGVEALSTDVITVRFSEPIVPVATLDVVGPDGTTTHGTTWSNNDTEVAIDIVGLLTASQLYSVDLTALVDVTGNGLRPGPVLLDGKLDFETRLGDGETCREARTMAQGAFNGNQFTWLIPSGAVGQIDGAGEACDWDYPGVDAYVVYEKTSGTYAQGGQMLAVEATATNGAAVNLVIREACDADDWSCDWGVQQPRRYADLPAGRYVIAASLDDANNGVWPDVRITVEETRMAPEGENCIDPYDEQSPTYSTDHWDIPAGAVSLRDFGRVTGVDDPICAANGVRERIAGADAVIAVDTPYSVALFRVQASAPVVAWVSDTCEVGATAKHCQNRGSVFDFWTTSPNPTTYVWLSAVDRTAPFPAVRIESASPSAGCLSDAQPLTIGAFRSTNGGWRTVNDACFPRGPVGVSIFGFTPPTDGILRIDPRGDHAVSFSDLDSSMFRHCLETSVEGTAGVAVRQGEFVCVHLPTWGDGGPEWFDVDFTPTTPVSLRTEVAAPFGSPNPNLAFSDATWTASTGGEVFVGIDSTGVSTLDKTTLQVVDRDGTNSAIFGMIGNQAVVDNGALFALRNNLTLAGSRVLQLWDGTSSPWSPLMWDQAPYPWGGLPVGGLSVDGTALVLASQGQVGDGTSFFSLSPNAPAAGVLMGHNNALSQVGAIAMDDEFVFVVGVVGGEFSVYRLALTDLSQPSTLPTRLGPILSVPTDPHAALALDDGTNPEFLYVRAPGLLGVQAVFEPSGSKAAWIGPVAATGADAAPYVLWWDAVDQALYTVSADRRVDGRVERIE